MPVHATRFLRHMRGGAQAHLLEGGDGYFYVTKFRENPQHVRILVNEWIAARLLEYLRIAAPKVAIVELDDGALPLAAPRDDRVLETRLVRAIPRDHRFVEERDAGIPQVRDVTGVLGGLFASNRVRGAIVRPDRYVAACLATGSGADEADRLLREIVRLSDAGAASPAFGKRCDVEIP